VDGTAPASSEPPAAAGPDDAVADDAVADDAVADETAAPRHGVRGRAVAGALTLVYVIWYALDLTTLAVDPFLFNRVHAVADSLVTRTVFAVLFLGVLFHATEGLQRAVVDLWPRWDRHTVGLRAAGGFVTMAVWVPAALVIVWPSIRQWWVR